MISVNKDDFCKFWFASRMFYEITYN